MKVFMLVTELEDYTIAYANGVAAHVPVTLAVPRRRYAGLTRWFDPAVTVRLMDWPRHRSLANLTFLGALTRLIRAERPSVIHLLSNNTLWLNLAAPFWRPVPLVTTVHDVVVHPGDRETGMIPRRATDMIVRQSGDIVVHGEGLKQLAADRFGKAPGRIHVLSHPVIDRYAAVARTEGLKRQTREGTFTVLLFGRIFAYKGLEVLIRAEALLGRRVPGVRFVIAGRGDDPWMFRSLMGDPARYDIRNRFIEDREVAQLFLDADLVVLPYTEASQSGVMNVAAPFGKPLLVTDVGELRASVEGNGMGLVVPPNDPERLAEAIARLATRPDLRAGLGANAEAWANGPNAPATVGAQAERMYRGILQRKAGGLSDMMESAAARSIAPDGAGHHYRDVASSGDRTLP
ncbi:glycosyltransferase family 4 protein [Paracoccaceae bacterium Fryx2]|nr:glycosyltransferase family 4 protein [Paracoccaceae bacterium Fryx2]